VRSLLWGLALVLVASTAHAQSDARWAAVFYNTGNTVQGIDRTTGNGAGDTVSETNRHVLHFLARTGTPVRFFDYADSANWWKQLGEAGALATSNPGVPDSIRFRQAGCFMVVSVTGDISTGDNADPVKYFQDGRQRGSQLASPTSGRWGMPCLFFTTTGDNNVGTPFINGALATSVGTHPRFTTHAFANGDSLALARADQWQIQTAYLDSITVLIRSDSLELSGTSGGKMVAWRWKNSAYWYPVSSGALGSTWVLLGMAEAYRAAGYVPRQKLNLHWTLDHVYPVTHNTAPSDSFWAYNTRNGWRQSMAVKAHGTERGSVPDAMRALWDPKLKAARMPHFPHTHVTGVGNYFLGTTWNFSTYADTGTIRQRWNFMERAISDTLGLPQARGYERTIGFPGDGVHFPHLYMFAQNRYASIRSVTSDSIGHLSNLNAGRRVFSGPTTTSSSFPPIPYRYVDPVTRRGIWVHGLYSHPGGDDSTWAMQPGTHGNDIQGYTYTHLLNVGRSILYDADFYWHPNENLQNPASSTDMPMSVYMRRLTYFLNRVKNIVTVEPSYRPKYPRRSSTPRG
jgi:hypothetical protein